MEQEITLNERLRSMSLVCHKCGRTFVPNGETVEAIESNGVKFNLHVLYCKAVTQKYKLRDLNISYKYSENKGVAILVKAKGKAIKRIVVGLDGDVKVVNLGDNT